MGAQPAQAVYAIDASTIDLCLSLFSWAPAANARAGVKLHTLLDLHGNIPSVIRITSTLVSDASFLEPAHRLDGQVHALALSGRVAA